MVTWVGVRASIIVRVGEVWTPGVLTTPREGLPLECLLGLDSLAELISRVLAALDSRNSADAIWCDAFIGEGRVLMTAAGLWLIGRILPPAGTKPPDRRLLEEREKSYQGFLDLNWTSGPNYKSKPIQNRLKFENESYCLYMSGPMVWHYVLKYGFQSRICLKTMWETLGIGFQAFWETLTFDDPAKSR